MAAKAEALGQCLECGHIFVVYRRAESWRALGTEGDCTCGNDSFRILSERSERPVSADVTRHDTTVD